MHIPGNLGDGREHGTPLNLSSRIGFTKVVSFTRSSNDSIDWAVQQ
jgi:hypothetical protein